MKKTLFTILLGAFGMVILVVPALAATNISFTPTNVSVSQGQTFTLTIGVNPQGTNNYTIKTELHYPAALLEVKSFTFTNSWMPIAQPSYDLTDNTNGVLIKTAGYPGGVSTATTFGTVSFFAKKSGSGTVVLDSNSFALDVDNQNALSGTSMVSFNITAPVIAPVEPITQPDTQPAVTPSTPSSESESTESQEDLQPVSQASFVVAMGSTLTLGTGNIWLGILIGLLILAVVAYAIYSFIRERRRKLK